MAAMVTSNVLIRNTQDGVGDHYTSYYHMEAEQEARTADRHMH